MMKVVLLLLFVLVLPVTAEAGNSFHLHIGSNHIDHTDRRYNEDNTGLGYAFDMGDNYGYTVGTYQNSWYKDSFYVGGYYKPVDYLSFNLMGITGYSSAPVLVAPTVSLHLLPSKPVGPMLTVAPTDKGAVVLFSLEWRLGD